MRTDQQPIRISLFAPKGRMGQAIAATIAEDGTIKDLKVISSSNPLLVTGVLDTVKTWKYKPTLLNKEPVEVITTITVNFTLGR